MSKGGFYDKKIDTDNAIIYNLFIEGMTYINQLLKKSRKPEEVKLPKLQRDIDRLIDIEDYIKKNR